MGSIHDRAQTQLGMAGGPDLAHEDQVERCPERSGNLKGHRYTATWQCQDHRVLIRIVHQPRDELAPGIGAVPEAPIIGTHGSASLMQTRDKPVAGQAHHLVKRARLLEQMSGSGYNRQVLLAGELGERLLIQLNDPAVVATDDQECH